MTILIKNMGIIISYMYFYNKIINKKIEKWLLLLMSIILDAIIVSVVDFYLPGVSILIIFLLVSISNAVIYGENNSFRLMENIVSLAASYVFFAIAVTFIGIVFSILYYIPFEIVNKYDHVLCLIINILLIQIPFKNKRMRKGMSIIKSRIYSVQVVSLSIFVIFLAIIMSDGTTNHSKILYYIFAMVLSICFITYWRTSITRHYLERLSLRNIDSLNAELVEKTNYIKELEEDKARIEKLNHKNYKLVPAMEGAVMHYLDGVKNFVENNADNPAFAEFAASKEMDMTGFIDEGNRLLGELNKMLAEWEDIVHNDDIDGRKDLPVCGVTRVDYILSYMYERSLKENFIFKVDVDSELTGLTEKIITDEDLGTLIADLIENAIIATRYNNGKDILVRLGMMKKEYTIEVYDSGIPFDKEVLAKYGYEQITTHADESGSGIGMMQTYEILSKCGASLFIDEFAEGEGMYTKRISVVFNKKHQYVLYTKRSDEEVAYLKKRSDLMIVRK